MVITRTPLRISFVGGGSDLPWFYEEEPGACVSAAIDRYVYVTVNRKYDGTIRAAYSQTENVDNVQDVQHELIRAALQMMHVDSGIEIHSIADIPAGTGLGSSSSFTVGLVAALHEHWGDPRGASWYAREAVAIELGRCGKAVGKQDQYAAAYGGLKHYKFLPDNTVNVSAIECDTHRLGQHCLLFDTGLRRQSDAGEVLQGQSQSRENVRALAALVPDFVGALTRNDFEACGMLLSEAWRIKRKNMRNEAIDRLVTVAGMAGAWGSKLCGAGGGGFLLVMAPPTSHSLIVRSLGLRCVLPRFGVGGVETLYHSA